MLPPQNKGVPDDGGSICCDHCPSTEVEHTAGALAGFRRPEFGFCRWRENLKLFDMGVGYHRRKVPSEVM